MSVYIHNYNTQLFVVLGTETRVSCMHSQFNYLIIRYNIHEILNLKIYHCFGKGMHSYSLSAYQKKRTFAAPAKASSLLCAVILLLPTLEDIAGS